MSLRTFIAADAKPTVENYNYLNQGILPKGIYSGGSVSQGPGRQIVVEEFSAKAYEGFTIVGDTQNLGIPASPLQSWAIVLYARSWVAGDAPPKSHHVEWRVLSWDSYTSTENPDADLPYYILFAKVDALSSNVRILPTEINPSFSDRINLRNICSTQQVIGTSNFNGPTGSVVYHQLGHSNYKVVVTPTEAPNVGIGDIWVEKNSTYFTVKCNGSVTTAFDWSVSSNQSNLGLDGQSSFGSRFGKALVSASSPVTLTNTELATNYVMLASNYGTLESYLDFPFVTQSGNSVTLSSGSASSNPVAWQIVSGTTHSSMLIDTFVMAGGSGGYLYDLNVDPSQLKVFAYPEGAYTNPSLKVENVSSKVRITYTANIPDGTKVRLVIFNSSGLYPCGTTTGFGTIQIQHNLNLDQYVPFISFRDIQGGTLNGYRLDIGRNSFKVVLPTGVSATLDWLLVPSFTS